MEHVGLLLLIGLGAGVFGGFFGIGGGLVVIPALIYLVGMGQKMAQGTTVLMMLPPIGILAAWEYYRRGEVSWPAAAWICLGFVAGGYIGARLAGAMPVEWLQRGFGLLLLGMGLKMVIAP